MNSQTIHRRTLVFIGAPRGGKTCLMAAWLDYLRSQESIKSLVVTEPGHDGEARISEVWRRIAELNEEPDQTAVGLSKANEIHFTYHKKSYCFEFHDYSGETATNAFTGELADEEIRREVVKTCEEADLLFLIVNLEDYRREASNPLQEVLVFLDEVAGRPAFGPNFSHGVIIYLSHPDLLDEDELESCRTELLERLRKDRPNLPDASIVEGSVVTRVGEHGLRFTGKEDPFSPSRKFAAWFADLARTGQGPSRASRFWASWITRVAAALLAVASFAAWFLWQQHTETKNREAWENHVADFTWFEEQNPESRSTDLVFLERTLDELQVWDRHAQAHYSEYYGSENFDVRVAQVETTIREQMRGLVQGIDRVEVALREHYSIHRDNFERLYPAILESARSALANPKLWDAESINEWRAVQGFIEAMEKGVFLEIQNPSFWFNHKWELQLELHVFQIGHSPPYGDVASPDGTVFGIQCPLNKSAIKGDQEYRFFWNESFKSNRRIIPATDMIHMRVYRDAWFGRGGSVLASRLKPSGIHYFGTLDKEFSLDTSNGEATCRFNLSDYRLYDEGGIRIDIPEVVRKASQ